MAFNGHIGYSLLDFVMDIAGTILPDFITDLPTGPASALDYLARLDNPGDMLEFRCVYYTMPPVWIRQSSNLAVVIANSFSGHERAII